MNGFLNQVPFKTTLQFLLFPFPDINQEMYQMLGLRDSFRHNLLSSRYPRANRLSPAPHDQNASWRGPVRASTTTAYSRPQIVRYVQSPHQR